MDRPAAAATLRRPEAAGRATTVLRPLGIALTILLVQAVNGRAVLIDIAIFASVL